MSTPTLQDEAAPPRSNGSWLLATPLLLVALAMLLAAAQLRDSFGLGVGLLGAAALAAYLGLRSPVLASVYLFVATFFRLAIPSDTFPVDPFLPAFLGVVLSTLLWVRSRTSALAALSGLEIAMVLYVAWNVLSAIAPHRYAPGTPLEGTTFSVPRFVLIGVVMPLAMYLIAVRIFSTERAIRVLIWSLIAAGAYSALVSIADAYGITWLVWPASVMAESQWPGRAGGAFNQPVVNGLVLIIGFLLAALVASHRSEGWFARALASVVAVASTYAIYLTLTRGVWLSFGLVLLGGTLFARGHRRWFVATLGAVTSAIALGWSTFTSADRTAGGVGSTAEIHDRLNSLATSLWAVGEEPVWGWGIGRFGAVNTYHHQQWSPEIPWDRGYGISSHLDLLGIMVELGAVGLLLWVTILVLIARELLHAHWTAPAEGLTERPLVLTAMLAFVALVTVGLTVDLRFFDFPNVAVMVLVGAAVSRARHGGRPGGAHRRTIEAAP